MAELTDEQKAAAIAGNTAKNVDDLNKGEPAKVVIDESTEEHQPTGEPEKPAEGIEEGEPESTQQTTFTKQFPNLKGESWDTYGSELETAYQNSFTEALRLKKDLDEARKVIANLPVSQEGSESVAVTATPDYQQLPEIQYIKAIQQRDMKAAFDSFSESYSQVRDEINFNKFRDAATPVGQAFIATEGREPTYNELFPKIAAFLGWESDPDSGRKGQTIKENLSTTRTNSSAVSTNKRSKVTDAQVDTYLRMFPAKNRADAVKELEEAF